MNNAIKIADMRFEMNGAMLIVVTKVVVTKAAAMKKAAAMAARPRDYYADEGRMRGARYVSPGGEYVGNRVPSFVPQRYEADSYSNQDYGDNRGVSDWHTEDGLFGEPQYRGALDSDYGRRYEFEDRNAFGYGGYGRDMGRGRRSAVAYDRYGAYGYGSQLYHGKGPKGYRRSDERIREDVCDLLSDDPRIDASNLEVAVKECEVTLSGTVNSRYDKRLVEDLAEGISGVKDVHNTVGYPLNRAALNRVVSKLRQRARVIRY